jgi:hypothetical protein
MKPPERIRAQNTCVKSGRTRIEYIAITTPIHQVLQPPLEPKEPHVHHRCSVNPLTGEGDGDDDHRLTPPAGERRIAVL